MKHKVINCVGGVISPLLSSIVLDELDKELEKRGHRYVRYADDSNIYVRSVRAGERVMKSITKFITQRLKLKVNEVKSAVDVPSKHKLNLLSPAIHGGVVNSPIRGDFKGIASPWNKWYNNHSW
jgi:RNA-directed DNA polymerase